MLWHLIGVLVATLFWVLPAQLDAFVAQSTGCHHNGTWYADKSLVPTVEKCLNCQCSKKTLVCRLKVCPEMPMPPPRGCVVVQKKNTCCPYLSCARLDAFYKIPTTRRIIAYLDHYERESIDRVVNENVLQRRSDDSEVDLYVCVKNGTVYKSGSAMSSSNLCTYCYCIGGSEKCVKPKCMLPVEGCKPIFVDSTCCPVRYDCSTKPSGKSSQEVRYRKTSNKHFLRMSQRLQRNRGCTVGKQYYGEGQKMKSDVDKPCDICFCIRGTRRCAPKKCSPSLKNCIPVVPKGQCCPSSYDCGSQRDYRRAQSSRQFNLFSMLFGKDDDNESNSTELSAKYPHDRQPPVKNANVAMNSVVGATSEKGIFDRIREGLEFIDSNNNQMLADNIDLMALQTTETTTKYETSTLAPLEPSTTTEVSFLDLLLGPSENLNNVANDVEESFPEEKTTTGYKGLSWVDLLLGPDEEDSQNTIGTTISDKLDAAETTTHFHADYGTTNIDRMGDDFDDFSGSGEITVGVMSDEELGSHLKINWEESTTTADPSSTLKGIVETTETTRITDETTQTLPTTLSASFEEVDSTTEAVVTERTTVKVQPTVKRKIKPKLPITTTLKPVTRVVTTPASIKTTTTIKKTNIKSTIKTTQNPGEKLHKLGALQLNETKPATPINKPEKNNDIFTKLLDGISDILSAEKLRNKTVVKAEKNTTSQQPQPKTTHRPINLPTSKQPPSFKPLPNVKHHIRINSKIANLTANSEMMSTKHAPKQNSTFKPLPPLASVKLPPKTTQKPLTTTTLSPTKSTYTTKKPITTTTEKPVNFKTNPTILDAEPLDNNSEPTLPPSLPNLKIIPFLPTDAVKADRNKPLYDFYHSNSQTAKIDYDLYDEANLYPSITERFPTYADLEDGSKAEYIYKFKVEGPVATVTSSAGKLDGATGTSAYLKYDFMGNGGPQTKGFSPPTETEGGFMPKEPLDIDEANESAKLEENYQATKHIIDITTGEPMKENTTKPIEITTPDPFKDVIKTELPPNLISLIEDKKNNLAAKQKLATIMQTTTPVAPLKKHNIHMTQNTDVLYSQLNNPLNKSTTVNKTRHDEILMEDKNSVESFLDLLFREKEDETSKFPTLSTSTTIPPFKSLPQNAIMNLPTEIMSTKPTSTTTTTTSMRPPTMKPTRRRTASTTTRVKSKPKSSIRNNIARNTTSTITTLPPKTTKPRVGTTRKYLITTTTTTTTTTPKPAPMTTTLASTISTTVHPFLMSPFDKLPFMDASFEVKPHSTTPIQSNTNNLLGLVYYKNSLNKFEGLEPAFESYHSTAAPTIDTSTSTTSPKHIEKSPSTSLSSSTANTPQHTSANNLIDSAGILKLAGCNIYGRMYRVGRIILELSSPCLECKCTEVGVKCGPLDC